MWAENIALFDNMWDLKVGEAAVYAERCRNGACCWHCCSYYHCRHYYHFCHSTAVTSLLLSLLTAVTASMRKQAGTARREIIEWGFPSVIFGVTITTHSDYNSTVAL
jgi:hypothetical protein